RILFRQVEHRELRVEAQRRAGNQRPAMLDARAVDGVARREVVAAVEHHVGAADDGAVLQPLVHRDYADIRVDCIERGARSIHLDRADVFAPIQDLPLQVGEVDLVGIDQREAADAGRGEVERCRATQPAGADDQRVRRAQLLLSFDPDLRQQDVPAVAEKLLVVQFGLACGFGVSLCATVGELVFTGSPLRKAMACESWKSSFEPSSVGLSSAALGGLVRETEFAGGAALSAGSFFSGTRPFSRWRCRSASRTRVSVSVGSSTTMSGVMPRAWIERPPGM